MNQLWSEPCLLSPSLICLNMCRLEEQIRELETTGIKMLHIDIIDGYFSPSMPLGFETVRQLRNITSLAFECHVMAKEPDYFVDELLDIGVQQIVFHLENANHVDGILNKIRRHNVRAGVALKPATPLCELEYILEKCDTVLLMLINPGYASSKTESQINYADKKIIDLFSMINNRNPTTKIEIDGRISIENIMKYGKEIVDIFACGTTCISSNDIKGTVSRLFEIRKMISQKERMQEYNNDN